MRILHVSLGNPYKHEGGLNRYCLDMMCAQRAAGDEVMVMYPGNYAHNNSSPTVRKESEEVFRINNALPVPITYGVDDPDRYMVKVNETSYIKFLKSIRPDIVHVHSFMGIHKEFFEVCVKLQIRLVFTTHDYYPFCFKCNLIDSNGNLCKLPFNAANCCFCNMGCGLSARTQILMQSEIYQNLKNNVLFKKLKRVRGSLAGKGHGSNTLEEAVNLDAQSCEKYERLHLYYREIMSYFHVIHCNSEVSKRLYEAAYPGLPYQIIPITHSGIAIGRHKRSNKNHLKISYFGGTSSHKGYNQLKEVIQLLPDDDSWEINLYGGVFPDDISNDHVHAKGYFTKKEEPSVWKATDLLIFISQWPESFGFSVLEALASGIPVICSDLAGSVVLLKDIEECRYEHQNTESLAKKIKYFLNDENYKKTQAKISNIEFDVSMEQHEKRIKGLYKEVLNYA